MIVYIHNQQKTKNERVHHMTKLLLSSELAFEKALETLNESSWNRSRTDDEIRSFLARREAAVDAVEP